MSFLKNTLFRLLSIADLKQILSALTGSTIVVDARRAEAYGSGHIPGALNVLWEDWCEDAPCGASETLHQPGWWGRLEDLKVTELEHKLSTAGLDSDSQIVVYADGLKAKGRDGRVAWMLLYFGAKNVSVLNGGWNAWTREIGEIETDCRITDKKSFAVKFEESFRIQLTDLRQSTKFGIDTRTAREHRGELYDYQPKMGRIPNTLNIPFSNLFAEDEKFLDADAFLSELRSLEINLESQKNIPDYSYCEVGVRAATFSLLYELYTGNRLPVYDGSFMEWSFAPDLPVERD